MKTNFIFLITLLSLFSSCGKSNSGGGTTATSAAIDADTSASSAVAAMVGGALSNSNASGTLAFLTRPKSLFSQVCGGFNFLPEALASNACPTFATTGAGCSVAGSIMWLSYGACNFGSSSATWTGTQSLVKSAGSAACGTFPNPGASANLIRQFVTGASSTTPSTATRTNAIGTTVTLDDASTNLSNFDSDSIAALRNGGYGTKVTYNGAGARSNIQIDRRVVASGRYDHTVAGSITVNEVSASSTTRTVSGAITVYHNLLKVEGNAIFNSVTHSDTCCLPISGSIQTTFAAGRSTPTAAGALIVGLSETLTFTGCGTATLTKPDGSSSAISLNNCF